MNQEANKILNTIKAMTKAFQNQDIEQVMASYETGASVMFEPGVGVSEASDIRQQFEGAFQINPEFEYPKGHEVYIANDIALHISPWVMRGQAPDGTNIEQSGLSIAVLRKQQNGTWLMVLDNPHGQLLLDKH